MGQPGCNTGTPERTGSYNTYPSEHWPCNLKEKRLKKTMKSNKPLDLTLKNQRRSA